jgi:DNA processing protein
MPVPPESASSDLVEVAAPVVRPGEWPSAFAGQESDRDALLVLSHLEGLTPRDFHQLARREGSARACLRAVERGLAGSDLDRRRVSAVDVAEVHGTLRRTGAGLVAPGDERYPEAALELPDPPAWLFVRGETFPPELRMAVAIVGARGCSPYGREVAELMGAGLAAAGVTVISGAARGIDGAAHRGALTAKGSTVAILGSGIDVPYPPEHEDLLEAIARSGAVVSEYPPGLRAHPRRFPARNRLVAALARAVVVVEGAPGSGSLITAGLAEDLHRDLLAVPGPVTSELSAAPHELIRDGAGLVRDAGDVLAAIDLAPRRSSRHGPSSSEPAEGGPGPPVPSDLPAPERAALDALTGTGQVVDQVAAAAGLGPSEALRALVSLELRGLVEVSGGRYRRVAQVR